MWLGGRLRTPVYICVYLVYGVRVWGDGGAHLCVYLCMFNLLCVCVCVCVCVCEVRVKCEIDTAQ